MSRNIKFRAWDKYNNVMVPRLDMYFFAENGIRDIPKHCGQYEFMQFTGLLDKNKKEIYDGDLLRVRGPFEELRASVLWGPVVNLYTWMNGETWLVRFTSGVEAPLYPYCKYHRGDDVEIIGNIYENPELIGKEV